MALESPEYIAVGLVQYFDHRQVLDHPSVVTCVGHLPPPELRKVRPFLCVSVREGKWARRARWTPITLAERPGRLLLRREWRWGGSNLWQSDRPLYLADGSELYEARMGAWVDLSAVDRSDEHTVGFLSPEGMDAVHAVIRAQHHRRVPWRHTGQVGPSALTPGGSVDPPTLTSASTRM